MIIDGKKIFVGKISDLEDYKPGTGVIIVSHRGKHGGSIVENTVEAFELALKGGADIIETDIARTADGMLILHHDETLDRLTGVSEKVENVIFDKIKNLDLKNAIGDVSGYKINTLDEFLEHMKGRCLINLDRCWGFLEEVYARVLYHGMENQILFKSPVHMAEGTKWLQKYDFRPDFMPIITEDSHIEDFESLPGRVKTPIVEIFVRRETDKVISEEFIEKLHSRGIRIWVNSLTLSCRDTLSAWHDDNNSMLKGAEEGWGWLVKKGVDVIQTDWPKELQDYLCL